MDALSLSARQQASITELHSLLSSVGSALRRSEQELAEMKHHCQILEERERVLVQKLELSESERQSLEEKLELSESERQSLEEELVHARSSLAEQQLCTPVSLSLETSSDLEQQLRESRLESEQLLEQLFLCQEELEYYFLLSQGQMSGSQRLAPTDSSLLMASEQAIAVINSSRNHLLSVF